MNPFSYFRSKIIEAIEELSAEGHLPADLDTQRIAVDPPRDAAHGDLATNAAMVLAKGIGMKPRDLAAILGERLKSLDFIDQIEIAGPGFINLRISDAFWRQRLVEVLQAGISYGSSSIGAGQKVNVEYVSANPTGPLHVGHARGAVVGDALAQLLEKAGFDVMREYYINDAGAQVDILARSAYLRYSQALGEDIGDIPEGLYPGAYLVQVGEDLVRRDADKWLGQSEDVWLQPVREFAVAAMLDVIRDDLDVVGVYFDVFTSERDLVAAGAVDRVMELLTARDLVYTGVLEPPKGKLPDDWEERPQTLFRAKDFGDDADRPIKKSDGSWTYFATDIAYHLDKFQRGFKTMIDVWGADHGGYVKRVRAAIKATTDGEGDLDVKLCQMVNLTDAGRPVKMSKRSGNFVTLRDVVDKVGRDVVRFIMLTRKNDAQLDFDFAKACEQSRENPVFYVQYAHARACSVMRHAVEALTQEDLLPAKLAAAPLDLLSDKAEIDLIKVIAAWPRLVEGAAQAHEPHRVAYYLGDLAAAFHALWNKGREDSGLRFIVADDLDLTRARLALVQGVALVVASGLKVIGVAPVEEMV
jgi:arginyl-tRNA synthetase